MDKISAAIFLAVVSSSSMSVCLAQSTTLTGSVRHTNVSLPEHTPPLRHPTARMDMRRKARPRTVGVERRDNRTYFQKHPKVKSAAVGAGVGAGAGAVTGLVTGRGVLRGAAIGAGTGAGVGLVRSSRTMRRHPIARDFSTGALVGLGLGAAASRRGRTMFKATAVGAAVGLGFNLIKRNR